MPILVNCACGKQYPVKEEFAGQRVKCPSCGQVLTIPGVQKSAPAKANSHTTAAPRTLNDFQMDDDADLAPVEVGKTGAKEKKKGGKGPLFALLGCGCVALLFGVGLVAVAGIAVLVGGVGVFSLSSGDPIASNTDSTKDKDKPVDPNKDKPVDPNKDKPVDPNKDKPVDPNKDKDKDPGEKPPPFVEKGPWKGHLSGIKALRVTNDGKSVVTAAGDMVEGKDGKPELAYDNTVRFWNISDGSMEKTVDVFKEGIAVAAISADGRYAAVAYSGKRVDGVWQKGGDHAIHIWDLTAKPGPKETATLKADGTGDVFCLAFKRSGTHLLSGGRDNKVRLWKISDGSQQQMFNGHTGVVTGVAFYPKDDFVLSCSADGTVRKWDPYADNVLQVGEFKGDKGGHKDIVWAIALSDDGKQLLTGGGQKPSPNGYIDGDKDTEIRLWNVAEAKEILRFKGHDKAVTCLAFSQDGKRALSGGADNRVRLWNVTTGQELASYPGHTDVVRCVAFLPDGKRAISGGDDHTLRVWNLPADVPDIIANLASPDQKVKAQAVQELAKFGDEAKPAVPALVKCLGSGDGAFRKEVFALLDKLKWVPVRDDVGLLATMAGDKNFPDGRLFALNALSNLGADAKPALDVLTAMLKENDPAIKHKAIEILGNIGPDARDRVYKQFIDFLRDPDEATAKAAAKALANLGKPSKDQIAALAGFLSDNNENVRRYALTTLATLGPEGDLALIQLVKVAKEDKLPEFRKMALTAVYKMKPKDKLTVSLMTGALDDADAAVGLQALTTLAEIGPAGGALSGLLYALDHKNEEVRKAADEAFGKLTFDKTQVKELAENLESNKSVKARTRMVEALTKLGADAGDAAESLSKVIKETDGELRLSAVRALAATGLAGKKAMPVLVGLLDDKSDKDEVRIEAAIALVKMKAPDETVKKALPHLIKGLQVTDLADMTLLKRQEDVGDILLQIGPLAADPLARTLDPTGDFYNSKANTPAGKIAANARLKVIEILTKMGPKANVGRVLLELATTQREDPDGKVREAAHKAYIELQKK